MEFTNTFMQDNAGLFNKRVAGARSGTAMVTCTAAHICFADDIYIYDCIEFNERFRYCDIASEIAFLAMDIDRYGRADLSNSFVQSYLKASADTAICYVTGFL